VAKQNAIAAANVAMMNYPAQHQQKGAYMQMAIAIVAIAEKNPIQIS
jgi:hypothetical protein